MTRKVFALLFFTAIFTVAANAQSICGLIPGPCVERMARQGYAPVDFMVGQLSSPYGYGGYGYGYYPYGYGNGTLVSAATGAIAGAITGGLVARAVSHRSDNQEYVSAPNGGQNYAEPRQMIFAQPKAQKPLDCLKPAGKRGKNEAACAAAEQEQARREAEARAEAERQALAASPFRMANRAGFPAKLFDGETFLGLMRVNQSWKALEPSTGYRAVLLVPAPGGVIEEVEGRIIPASGFQGWVITTPCPKTGCWVVEEKGGGN